MTSTVKRSMLSAAILAAITAVCVLILALCNTFFPKYVPTLDTATASLINSICPLGVSDETAFNDGYIKLLSDADYGGDVVGFNKENKTSKANVAAVYLIVKGDKQTSYIIESSSNGRDGDVSVLTAFGADGKIVGAVIKSQKESYFDKVPSDLFDGIIGASEPVDLYGLHGKTGATFTLNAVNRSVNAAITYSVKYRSAIIAAVANGDNSENATNSLAVYTELTAEKQTFSREKTEVFYG